LGYSTMLFQLHKFGYTAPKQVERWSWMVDVRI
jgi:hypothetical protein